MVVQYNLEMASDIANLEIRKLPAGSIRKLVEILESSREGWKDLMSIIPVECQEGNPSKYSYKHIQMIESAGKCQGRPYSEILLEEWGTSGRCRPTVSFLLQCLTKAELFRAADFVAVDILKVPPPGRPETGPAVNVECDSVQIPIPQFIPSAPPAPSITTTPDSPVQEPSFYHKTAKVVSCPDPTAALETDRHCQVVRLNYSVLLSATEQFSPSRLLGGGAGGSVYLARLPHLGALAIKRLHSIETFPGSPFHPQEQFRNEVQVLAGLSHQNLLPLVGYSDDGPSLCIAYRFMKHGSLLDCLSCENGPPLAWKLRVEIGLGAARGLSHLHVALPKPLVHRDVKSANILLDDDFTPKLGDFGLARPGSSGNRTCSVAVTINAAGTSAYMAPEAHRGDVSVKLDVYSFGVVLLELLTGLPPVDETREGHDLVTFVEDADDTKSLVDCKAGDWPENVVFKLFNVAESCLEKKRGLRPTMSKIIEDLTLCFS